MAKANISEYDATAGNNTEIDGTSLAEGMAPSGLNNALRELMAHLKDAYSGTTSWDSVTDSITAGSTQTQAGATAMTTIINRVTTSGTDGDGVKLPTAVAGLQILVINDDSAQTIQIWPNTDDAIDGGSADAVDANALSAGSSRLYIAADGTNWYTASPSSNGWKLIQNQSASSSSSLDFTTDIGSTYDAYMVVLTNFLPATDGTTFEVLVSLDGGSTYRTTAADYEYAVHSIDSNNNAAMDGNSVGDTKMSVAIGIGSATGEGVSGAIEFAAPSSQYAKWRWLLSFLNNASPARLEISHGGGVFNGTTGAVDAFRLKMASGNIASGTAALYGLVK